jgi:ABC-type transport system involved in cytochrome bd biosynthesis fused ATPase/permease subunit
MVPKIRRPLVVGSVGLTASAWLMQLGHPTGAHWGETIVWGAIALCGGLWWFRQQQPAPELDTDAALLDRATVEQALKALEPLLDQLERESATPAKSADSTVTPSPQPGLRDIAPQRWRERLALLKTELDRDQLNVAIVGGKSVGKTTLARRLTADWLPGLTQTVTLTDTPALFDKLDAIRNCPRRCC